MTGSGQTTHAIKSFYERKPRPNFRSLLTESLAGTPAWLEGSSTIKLWSGLLLMLIGLTIVANQYRIDAYAAAISRVPQEFKHLAPDVPFGLLCTFVILCFLCLVHCVTRSHISMHNLIHTSGGRGLVFLCVGGMTTGIMYLVNLWTPYAQEFELYSIPLIFLVTFWLMEALWPTEKMAHQVYGYLTNSESSSTA